MLDGEIDELLGRGEPGRRDGFDVAEHLAGDPVLAIAAVVVAAEHAEGEGVGTGQDVEEGLFLDGVAGEASRRSRRGPEDAIFVEADAADAVAAGLDEAAVAAGEALDVAVGLVLDQRLGSGSAVLVEHVLQGREALHLLEKVEGHGRPGA